MNSPLLLPAVMLYLMWAFVPKSSSVAETSVKKEPGGWECSTTAIMMGLLCSNTGLWSLMSVMVTVTWERINGSTESASLLPLTRV